MRSRIKDRFNRQTFLEKKAQEIIAKIKVGPFGLGGGGSHCSSTIGTRRNCQLHSY